ncbi:MAG: UDP-N-acetylmuramoyl-L-alanyl-D-glutamate--2,6-diaminopimelate ligase [Mogibacterium sp.]|nr:UDP-N-acetylmuramoyl-L-alanyl-D-glutamate--2,6-diaminopimelate ligase [Mogibacterium sp.]
MEKRERKKKVQDFIDELGLAGLLVSVDGQSPCNAIMDSYTNTGEDSKTDALVKGVTYNSLEVEKDFLFVCKGVHFKEEYLEDAIKKGAVCYVREGKAAACCASDNKLIETANQEIEKTNQATEIKKQAIEITNQATERKEQAIEIISQTTETTNLAIEIIVSDIRKAMPIIAKTFYGDLSEELKIVGVTGTKGKSTTAYFMRYILDDYMAGVGGKKSAICSGIDNYDGVIEEESHLTSPEIMELYMHMNNAIESGIDYMTMEVSSQALKYDRVEGIEFEAGAFLNIGTDHISPIEHPDFDDYFEAKLRLFAHCRKACYSLDSEGQERIKAAAADCPIVITFSQKDEAANIFGYDVKSNEGRVSFRARGCDIPDCDDFDEEFALGTFGTINIENALAAISMSALSGIPMEYIRSGLSKAKSPGRMEVFYSKDGGRIAIVDYAHNKLSYERFFETIKDEFPGKKMIIVFGCPGMKALARREELGTLAGRNCAHSIITEEDYGEEDVNKICNEIAVHVAKTGGSYEIITDRVEAVKKAITLMDDDTILFLPGKGRETREKRGNAYIDTPSDVEVVEEYL